MSDIALLCSCSLYFRFSSAIRFNRYKGVSFLGSSGSAYLISCWKYYDRFFDNFCGSISSSSEKALWTLGVVFFLDLSAS